MAEPTSAGVLAASMVGAGLAGLLTGVDSTAAVGALCGALIYFISAKELPLPERLTYFLVSFVMGYLLAPAITGIEMWGIKPFTLPAPAAFGASLMVVTVSLAALKRRRQSTSPNGGIDG